MDLGLEDPIAEARRQNDQALNAWLADWFQYIGTDLGLDFYLIAAQEYRRAVNTRSHEPMAVWSGPEEPSLLSEDRATASLDLALEVTAGSSKMSAEAKLSEHRRNPRLLSCESSSRCATGSTCGLKPWAAAIRRTQPPASTGVGSSPYLIVPMHAGSIPLRLRLSARERGGPRRPDPQAPPQAGIMLEAEVQGRVFSRTVPVVVRSSGDVFRIILGDEDQDQRGGRKFVRLRPLPGRQRIPLGVTNPTASARDVIVQLRRGPDDSGAIVATSRMTIPPVAMQPVVFTTSGSQNREGESGKAAGPPGTQGQTRGSGSTASTGETIPLPELNGPLRFRVVDARNSELVLGQRVVVVEVANPVDYVRVQEASLFSPRPLTKEPNQLNVSLRSLLLPSDPAAAIELVLRPERIPGLLRVEKGVLRGKLPPGANLTLTAEGSTLIPR